MQKATEVYMRERDQVRGPLELRIVRLMLESGQLPPQLEFSFDRQRWLGARELAARLRAAGAATPAPAPIPTPAGMDPEPGSSVSEEIAALLPKIIRSGADTKTITRILKRARRAAWRLKWLFPPLVVGSFLSVGAGLGWLGAAGARLVLPDVAPAMAWGMAALPAALLAATFTHGFGNLAIRALSGLGRQSRQCLALHLPWNRAPREWPKFFRRWIYCGDWMIESSASALTPYIRAFVTGPELRGIDDELAIWNELMQGAARGRQMESWETGHSVRELAKVDALPAWARDVTPGMGLGDMERSLGAAGHAWAVNLLKRAAMRKRSFGRIDFAGDLHEALFEFHYCRLSQGREGLLVVIRPHREGDSLFIADSVSDSLAA